MLTTEDIKHEFNVGSFFRKVVICTVHNRKTMATRSKLLLLIILQLILVGNATATTFYIDPANGSGSGDGSPANPWRTLEEVVSQNRIESFQYVTPYSAANPQLIPRNQGAPVKAGDTLMLLGGLHGELFLQNYINTDFITIMAAPGQTPILKKARFQACKYWRLTGLTVSSEPYGVYIKDRLIYVESHSWQGPASHIDISDCDVFSTAEPWITAGDWVNKASQGIYIKGDSVNLINNRIRNISFGIHMVGDHIRSVGNIISNFSGDGLRILGSYDLVEGNTIKNCYDVDDNHDDGIQSFTTNGYVVDHNIVRGNTILNFEDPNQPLLGPLQGIGCFDGFFNDWTVENNLISVNHWHGITFLGANNCRIFNNTVLDPTPDITPGGSWIMIDDHKNGMPSTNCQVRNNVANQFVVDGATGNNLVLNTYAGYTANFADYAHFDFHLLPTSALIDAADDTVAPPADFDGIARPQGAHADIGAFEFRDATAAHDHISAAEVRVYPNPVKAEVTLAGDFTQGDISISDMQGHVVARFQAASSPLQ